MPEWSLEVLFSSLHEKMEVELDTARKALAHPGAKGDASEAVWIEIFNKYLPARYKAASAFVVDSKDSFSEQIDVLIFDHQYSPFIFEHKDQIVVPAESVYAVFEAKQTINAGLVAYAQKKVASVRRLHRTSLPIPHAGGEYPPKPPQPIIGGILTLDSDWNPALGDPFREALGKADSLGKLDIGCVASHGFFRLLENGDYQFTEKKKQATAFLLELIAQLQLKATVPMLDVRAYSNWID